MMTALSHFHAVASATPNFKWKNSSTLTRGVLEEFMEEYDNARAVGGFVAPVNMNPVTWL